MTQEEDSHNAAITYVIQISFCLLAVWIVGLFIMYQLDADLINHALKFIFYPLLAGFGFLTVYFVICAISIVIYTCFEPIEA